MINNSNFTMGGIIVTKGEMVSPVIGVDVAALDAQTKRKKTITYKPLTWNVYYEDFNARRIATFNLFQHGGFYEDCYTAAKKFKDDKDKFADAVRRSLHYYYWSKCEWEIILTAWPPRDDFREEKIDVADQVELNWDVFIDYLWENKGALHAS